MAKQIAEWAGAIRTCHPPVVSNHVRQLFHVLRKFADFLRNRETSFVLELVRTTDFQSVRNLWAVRIANYFDNFVQAFGPEISFEPSIQFLQTLACNENYRPITFL